MLWTWDEGKNEANLRRRGLSFEAAAMAFDDPMAATIEDPHTGERRWRTLGMVGGQVLLVVHTWPERRDENDDEEVGRIISARKATSRERRAYEEGYL